MDEELRCDFYIGANIFYSIKLMTYETLKGFKKRLKFSSLLGNFYWQEGSVLLSFRGYKHYILTGDPYCISTWVIMVLNKLTFKKTYLWCHGWYGDENWLKKIFKMIFFGLSDKVFLYGEYARDLMVREGFNPKKLVPLYNSLDYNKQVGIRARLRNSNVYKQHFQNSFPVLIFIGRIQAIKKIEHLIQAMVRINEGANKCNLVVVGKDVEGVNLQEMVNSYNLDKFVWFYGPCYNEEIIAELIFNADLCVSPGNVGLTAIHSLVYGTPLLTHGNFKKQMPEFEAIQEGETGGFYKENSIEDLAEKILKWCWGDKPRRSLIREKCYSIIEKKYNPNVQINIIKSTIN
ncbi:MAG: glycosyltransferase family 4 protein [Ginsengibacter sp.]